MDAAAAFVPIDRLYAVVTDTPLPDRTGGAALFADLSGFTALTEALVQDLGARRGAEELSRQLNRIYTALIAEIHARHGSVISFSGDAITCWFDDANGPATRNAAASALALQAALAPLATLTTPNGMTVQLAVKVAVASGAARRFVVGDPNIQLFDALVGSTLDTLARTEQLAARGEVLLADGAAAQLGAAAHWGERRGDARVLLGLRDTPPLPWPALTAAAPAGTLRRWVAGPVIERLSAGREQFLAEIRPVAVLFLRFGGIDFDADDQAGLRLDALVRWVQRTVERHGGTLLQLVFGDKGAYLYAAFGAPLAYGDDTLRAADAADALRSGAPGQGFGQLQIGVSRGRVYAGPYGSAERVTYGVLGDPVNAAARLMQRAAPGEALLTDAVARAALPRYDLRPVGELQLKGKAEPVAVAALLGRRAAERGPAQRGGTLVGRVAERERLNAARAAAASGGLRYLRLSGPTGIGKSRLLLETAADAAAAGWRVLSGAGRSGGDARPYAAWQPIVADLLGVDLANHEVSDRVALQRAQIAALEQAVQHQNPEWSLRLPLLGDLLDLAIPDNPTTAAFEARLRQSSLNDLVGAIAARAAAEHPLLLLIDDAQWLDEVSVALLTALCRALADAPVLLVLAHRPTDRPLLPELDALPAAAHVPLTELDEAAVRALLTAQLGSEPPQLLVALLLAETDGNPFFLEELTDALREGGQLIRRADGEWRLSDGLFAALQQTGQLIRSDGIWVLAQDATLAGSELNLPDTIEAVVLGRIDRLPEGHKLTIKAASVIGKTFSLPILMAIHPDQPEIELLLDQAEELERRDLTQTQALSQLLYAFRHSVTHTISYSALLHDQRRRLHERVLALLERLEPDAISQLAHHASAAEAWEQMLRYHLLAGEQAQRVYANRDAERHYQTALQAAERLPPERTAQQRQQVSARLGELLTTTGQYVAAEQTLRTALDLAHQSGQPDAAAHVCRWLARLCEYRSQYADALEWVQAGLAELGERDTATRAELLTLAALTNQRRGDYARALELANAAIAAAQRIASPATLAFSHSARANVQLRRGQVAEAIADLQIAQERYRASGQVQGQATTANTLATAYFEQGELELAARSYRAARDMFDQTGDVRQIATVSNNLGEIARYQLRPDDALRYYNDALASFALAGGSEYVTAIVEMNLGATHTLRGEPAAARALLSQSQDRFTKIDARDFLPELHRHLAEADVAAGDTAGADTQIAAALELARELGMRAEEGVALRVRGELALRRGDAVVARADCAAALAIAEEVGDRYQQDLARAALARAGGAASTVGG